MCLRSHTMFHQSDYSLMNFFAYYGCYFSYSCYKKGKKSIKFSVEALPGFAQTVQTAAH